MPALTVSQKRLSCAMRVSGGLPAMIAALIAPMEMPAIQSRRLATRAPPHQAAARLHCVDPAAFSLSWCNAISLLAAPRDSRHGGNGIFHPVIRARGLSSGTSPA
jgi:hypothetical protein